VNNINTEKCCLALGYFDAVHLGHQEVIGSALKYARENNIKCGIFSFSKIDNKGDEIISCEKKEQLLYALGIDFVIMENFEKIRNTMPDEFVKKLTREYNCVCAFCGEDYSFGKNRLGDVNLLGKLMANNGGSCVVVKQKSINGSVVSSSNIKKFLSQGNVKYYLEATGREYSLTGIVDHGKGIGSSKLVPTINIQDDSIMLPKNGVYYSITTIENNEYKSITNIGFRPTVDNDEKITVETYILGFDSDVYGKKATVVLKDYLREEKQFASLDDLKKQIKTDIEIVENL